MPENYDRLRNELKKYGQEHLLAFWNELDDAGKRTLSSQLNEIDFSNISELIESHVLSTPETELPGDISPAPFFPLVPHDEAQKKLYADAVKKGVELLSGGKVAALTVAGGQGTRLGFDGPKGTYPITPVKNKTLFQYFAESIKHCSEKYGSPIRWFIMTSEINDAPTRAFFEDNSFFGLDREMVFFFVQGTMPAIGYDGKILMASKSSLALSPNGHGGTLLALRTSGALDIMKNHGIEYISYFQVDNPLVPPVEPFFIGLHSLEGSEISARMLSKTGPNEKLGNFCIAGGRLTIIEYSDMPRELTEMKNPDGTLKFIAGSPAIHVFSRDFVERLTLSGRLNLPWHRADKKVPHIDKDGREVNPDKPNAVKLESFIFDALPLASKTMVLEAAREEQFGPVKNASGVDSAESARGMLIARDARRLEVSGVEIPRKDDGSPDCVVEISPALITDDSDAAEYIAKNPVEIAKGETLYIG